MSEVYTRARAGDWFLNSGIQEPSGGVARFYLADSAQNKPVSTEITGYAASALAFLYEKTGDAAYGAAAERAGRFLVDEAWDAGLGIFPFEPGSRLAYFFDSGIIVRGLLAVWRITKEQRLLDTAVAAARGMVKDFWAEDGFHPILELPAKRPVAREAHWSRSGGCYQGKSALALWDVAQITGDDRLRGVYFDFIAEALESCRTFLPGTRERLAVMDRLHAACYFLEALWPLLDSAACAAAYRFVMDRVSYHLRDIAPDFVRSDVYAQLLRARVYGARAIPVDRSLAEEEATALAAFQGPTGGFWFGRRGGETIPHINPVSTAFAIQALEVWRAFGNAEPQPCLYPPI